MGRVPNTVNIRKLEGRLDDVCTKVFNGSISVFILWIIYSIEVEDFSLWVLGLLPLIVISFWVRVHRLAIAQFVYRKELQAEARRLMDQGNIQPGDRLKAQWIADYRKTYET